MKKIISAAFLLGASTLTLCSCGTTQVGTATGGALGSGLGYVVSGGNVVGSVIGGGAGALFGNQVTRPRYVVTQPGYGTYTPVTYKKYYHHRYYRNGRYFYY